MKQFITLHPQGFTLAGQRFAEEVEVMYFDPDSIICFWQRGDGNYVLQQANGHLVCITGEEFKQNSEAITRQPNFSELKG